MTPAYLSQGFKVIKKTHPSDEPKLETLPYAIHFLYGLNFTPVNDMEFAFPVDFERADGFDHLIKAIEIVVDEVSKAAKPCEELDLMYNDQLWTQFFLLSVIRSSSYAHI